VAAIPRKLVPLWRILRISFSTACSAGSTDAARRAGTNDAENANAVNTTANVRGSSGEIPNRTKFGKL
jgi:hypothetical protein